MKIQEIDNNFKIETKLDVEGIKFYDAENAPFKIYGIFKEGGRFRRMPEAVARTVSEGVYLIHSNTAGGRVRFVTDSRYVAISAKIDNPRRISHFSLAGTTGFDIYSENNFMGTVIPQYDVTDSLEGIVRLEKRGKQLITINLPLYTDVIKLYIGLEENASIEEAAPYANDKPVLFYGSSITHGGCASRAGMSYENILSRWLNLDYVNLGFSGNAKGEDEMAEYISKLDMSMFVLDYDYNAPTAEHLAKTHEKLFLAVRKLHPTVPIIIMSKPKYYLNSDDEKRLEIIKKTYKNAINKGDDNVYMIDNKALTALCGSDGTVEGIHPNDYGFVSIANAISNVIKEIFKENE